ncbi:MAG: hypothetical protein H6730_34360 [Deltaproteobacteria bacterium]|nr:hypothetical protein [Deltaproteobacteria bacterium]
MSPEQLELLSNLLDALDRLFDRECRAIDILSLVYATHRALGPSELGQVLQTAVIDLERIVKGAREDELEREAALSATNDLRLRLAELV